MSDKKQYKYIIIIPTCAKPHIEFKFLRLLKNTPESTLIIYSVNPIDYGEAEVVFEKMDAIQAYSERYYGRKHNVVRIWEDGPTSFGDACNKGYEYALQHCEDPECIIFLNDDVSVTKNWQKNQLRTLQTDVFFTNAMLVDEQPGRPVDELPLRIGFVGPMSDRVGSQQAIHQVPEGVSVDQIAHEMSVKSVNKHGQIKNIFTSFLSGFCLTCSPEALKEIYERDGFIFDPIFKVGGFEDNDLMVRARMSGWGCLIDTGTFVGHDGSQTLDTEFKDQRRGMLNQVRYYEKWREHTQKEQKIVGAYRVAIFNMNNLAQFGSSIRVNSKFLDGMAVLLTNNPATAFNSYDRSLFDRMHPTDQEFLMECKSIDNENELAQAFKSWMQKHVGEEFELTVECWDLNKSMNERTERNHNYSMATSMDADWVISIDSDEAFEDRIKAEDIRKLANNPDPLISLYSFGWLNHYESMNVIRTDQPFCFGYARGMNGVRMWRVWDGKHFPVVAGNEIGFHCGNAPEYGAYVIRGTDIRFRHMSMVREIDRAAKTSFYNNTDNDKDEMLIGGDNYNHISRAQDVPITLYRRNNGIGFFNLAYDQEDPILLAEKMQSHFGLSKHTIVWTSEWAEEDQKWIGMNVSELPSESQWRDEYPTGPCRFLAVAGKLHKVDFIYQNIVDGGLAQCRNAALKHYKDNYEGTIGWALYLDPDETPIGSHYSDVICTYRRMAEATDTMAFKFKFTNQSTLANGKRHNSTSESMRMLKLEKHVPIFFTGHAHETLEYSLNELKKKGFTIIVDNCAVEFINYGLNKSPKEIANKLEKYQRLVIESIHKDPYSSAAWTSLGMTYEQDRDEKNAEISYERACLVAGTAFLPFQALGLMYARKAVGLFYAAMIRTKPVPALHKDLNNLFSTLRELVGEFPVIDDGGAKVSAKFELPDFPYDEIVYDEGKNQIVRRKEISNGDNQDQGSETFET